LACMEYVEQEWLRRFGVKIRTDCPVLANERMPERWVELINQLNVAEDSDRETELR
jgi:hypothetical protein